MHPQQSSNKSQKYHRVGELGSGAYGTVYKAVLTKPQSQQYSQKQEKEKAQVFYALKQMKLTQPDQGIPSTAIRQISILKELRHPNVVHLHQVITEPTSLTLVFENLECDLKKYYQKIPKEQGLNPKLVQSFCYQLLKGMNYCHKKNVIHRDLKPQNVLLSKDQVLKIADFGLARGFGIPTKGFTHEVVTLWYRSPQILLESKDYCEHVDMWSIGCIFAELVSLRPLFPGSSVDDQLGRIFRFVGTPNEQTWPGVTQLPGWKKYNFQKHEKINIQELLPRLNSDGLDLLMKLLQPNPKKRIFTDEALKHPYFNDIPESIVKLSAQRPKYQKF